jgi:hypothetical protein
MSSASSCVFEVLLGLGLDWVGCEEVGMVAVGTCGCMVKGVGDR